MDLTTLPFDQYSRYRRIADALDAARPLLGRGLRILDVGGYSQTRRGVELLPGQAFLPDDTVTVVDRPECQLPGYIQGDGRGLSFESSSFDFVISCDTLEHVPPEDRPGFWGELLRVARLGVMLTAPSRSAEAEAAERLVMAFIEAELGQIQPQLDEHRAFGLPDPQETQGWLASQGLRQHSVATDNVHHWTLLMIARHTRPICYDDDFGEQLDSYYTRFLSTSGHGGPGYRRLWLVEKVAESGWFEASSAALAQFRLAEPAQSPAWSDFVGWQLQVAALRDTVLQKAAYQQRITALEEELRWRAGQMAELERRAGWLERQASDARSALERISHGRVMRLLQTLKRR